MPLRVRRSTKSPGMECTPSKMPGSGAALAEAARLRRQVLAVREPVGGRERRKKRGLQLYWIPPCQAQGRGLCWTSGEASRWKACEGPVVG